MLMTPEVKEAVEEIRSAFPGHRVEAVAEAQGGAYVTIHDVPIGPGFVPSASWIGFLITFQYPRADVYPHFMDPAVKRANGLALESPVTGPVAWNGRQAIQISRRSNRLNYDIDTAAFKLSKVLEFLRTYR